MSDLKSIVSATDLSVPARCAAERAALLAHEHRSDLTLLHIMPQGPIDDLRRWLGVALGQRIEDEARRDMEALADALRATHQVTAQTRLEQGGVLDALDRVADELAADLIVLGARGAGVLRRFVLGATAERLLRRTQRPLLVVRQPAREPYHRALLALDFSPWSAAVVALARRVAPRARPVLFTAVQVPFEEKLHFAGVDPVHVEQYREQARASAAQQLQQLANQAQLPPGTWEPCIVDGDASMKLMEQEKALDCDLVVVGKHGQSAAEDLLLGSVTNHLLAEGRSDVLVATLPLAS